MSIKQIFFTLFTFNCLGCNNVQKVNFDPHYPNIGITLDHLIINGWESSAIDHGICSYVNMNSSPHLLCFYLHDDDDCTQVKSQELYVNLNYQYEYNMETSRDNFNIIREHELTTEIDSILNTFASKRISELEIVSSQLAVLNLLVRMKIKLR